LCALPQGPFARIRREQRLLVWFALTVAHDATGMNPRCINSVSESELMEIAPDGSFDWPATGIVSALREASRQRRAAGARPTQGKDTMKTISRTLAALGLL